LRAHTSSKLRSRPPNPNPNPNPVELARERRNRSRLKSREASEGAYLPTRLGEDEHPPCRRPAWRRKKKDGILAAKSPPPNPCCLARGFLVLAAVVGRGRRGEDRSEQSRTRSSAELD
jgi:hypothetical protein